MPEPELSTLDRHVFSYYLCHAGQTLNIDGRFYPFGDLVSSIRSKIQLNTSKFGKAVSARADCVARYFVSFLIERGALSDIPQEVGNNMHQFQVKVYRQLLQELADSDEILRSAKGKDDEDWQQVFAALV